MNIGNSEVDMGSSDTTEKDWEQHYKEEMKCFDKETCMECEYKIRADERKKAIDEVYVIALNENHDTLIEWLQANIRD